MIHPAHHPAHHLAHHQDRHHQDRHQQDHRQQDHRQPDPRQVDHHHQSHQRQEVPQALRQPAHIRKNKERNDSKHADQNEPPTSIPEHHPPATQP